MKYQKALKKAVLPLALFLIFFLSVSCSDDKNETPQDTNCNNRCETWELCNVKNNTCELKKDHCIYNSDCGENKTCNDEHKCVDQVVVDCQNDTDCKTYQTCSTSSNTCVLKEGMCAVEADCNNPRKACEDNFCVDKPFDCAIDGCHFWESCNTETKACDFETGKCSSDSDCENGLTCGNKGYCKSNDFVFTTIQNIQKDNTFIDQNVQTIGIVTAIAISQNMNPKGLYIQYGSMPKSGLYVYFIEAGPTTIKVGDRIRVTGIIDRDEGKARIRTRIADIELIEHGDMPYTPVDIDYFTSLEQYESMLTNVVLESGFNLREIRPEYYAFIDGNQKKIYVNDTISILNHLSLVVRLDRLKGILDNYEGQAQMLPRTEEDILVYMPVCETDCLEWEECVDRDTCRLAIGRCVTNNDCQNSSAICNPDTHYCEEPSLLENGDIDHWTSNAPTGYLIGDALQVTQEDNKVEASTYSARIKRIDSLKEGNEDVEFLSPPIAVDYTKNYVLSLAVLENNYDIDAKIYYNAYDVYNTKIGSGIAGGNDFTQNVDNWVELSHTTGFIDKGEIWYGPPENLSYIRFGVRLYKAHCNVDVTCPSGFTPTGTGYMYVDSLEVKEAE